MSKVLLSRINLIILLISCITAAFFNFGKNNNVQAPTTTAPNNTFPTPNSVMTPAEFQKNIADAQAAAQKKANQALQQNQVPVTPPPAQSTIAPPLQTAPVSAPPTQLTPPPKPAQVQPGIQAPLPATTTPQQSVPNLPMNNPQATPQQQQPQPYTGFGTTPPNTSNNSNKQSGGWNIKY
jgi:hypothetical protein